MERTGLWNIKGSEGYIYAASNLDQKKVPPETGSKAQFGFGRPFLPWNAASKGNIVELSDATMNLLLNWQSSTL